MSLLSRRVIIVLLLFCNQHYGIGLSENNENSHDQCIDVNRKPTDLRSLVSEDFKSLSDEFVTNFAERNYQFATDRQNHLKNTHPLREGTSFSWADVDVSVRAGGHEFCSMIRDNYACYGPLYEEVLRRHKPLDKNHVNLGQVRPKSFIFMQGNSYLAEVVYYWLCYDEETLVWFLKPVPNSIFAYHKRTQSALLLIDNDSPVERNPVKTACSLQRMALSPSVILVGKVNSQGPNVEERTHIYAEAFPDAVTLELAENQFLPRDCPEHECDAERDGEFNLHKCVPGPIARVVEDMQRFIVNASYSYKPGQRSRKIVKIRGYRNITAEKEAKAFAKQFKAKLQ